MKCLNRKKWKMAGAGLSGQKNKPELVAPAGDWAALSTAVANGADSVYFGIKRLNMRAMADNFEVSEIPKIMGALHQKNKKGYLALNTLLLNSDLSSAQKVFAAAQKSHVDAVILWDMAAFGMAQERKLRIHISTQASVANVAALKFWTDLGARRVVLARECQLKDIVRMRQVIEREKIICEIETFVHGAMCLSVSGRCFLSEYSFGKSANRGECLQPCRREYRVKDLDDESEYILGQDYILSPKDLCSIDFIDRLMDAGIYAFKIEGRMRASEYLMAVTRAYREAIDAYSENRLTDKLKRRLRMDLEKVYNRGFSNGFYFGRPKEAVSRGLEHSYEKRFLGEVSRFFKKINVAEVRLRSGSLKKGEALLLIGKTTPARPMTVSEMQQNKVFIEEARKGDVVALKMPFAVKPGDKVFSWSRKEDAL